MKRLLIILLMVSVFAPVLADDRPIEMRGDRVIIYPQRLELTGEESLLDILLMYPDLMQSGFSTMVGSYSVRVDNVTVGLDTRIFLNQLKAKLVSKIQICDNTGVAKGTVGLNRVIDINLLRLDEGLHGEVGGGAGTDNLAQATTELRYGSKSTDIYAAASYAYDEQERAIGQQERLFAHMTNWFGPRDRLLSYFNQSYLDTKDYQFGPKLGSNQRSIQLRERYFHNFNDKGTELLVLGSYQRSNIPKTRIVWGKPTALMTDQDYVMGMLELNTPLGKNLSMMLGWEGDFTWSTLQLGLYGQQKYLQNNNDFYLQYNYRLGRFLFTLGDRVMFYHYSLFGEGTSETRNNIEASAVATIDSHSQAQLAYHRKFSNPSFSVDESMSLEEWMLRKGNMKATYIDELKLGYTYARPNLTLSAATYLLGIDEGDDVWKLQTSAYFKRGIFAVTAGVNYYNVHGSDNDFATFHLDPRVSLPWQLQVSAQAILATKNATLEHETDSYLALQVSKRFGNWLELGLDWHDITSSEHSALMGKATFRF